MISGLVLKYLNGECFVIRRGYETARSVSSSFCLTVPLRDHPARLKLVLSDSALVTFFWVAANVWFRASIKSSQTELPPVSSPETVINVAFLTDDNR